jgi:hypothetical protein
MKKMLCVMVFLVLAAQLPLWSYDQSPSDRQILPEAVWAAAAGGGTWVTEVQITCFSSAAADINVYFYYNGGYTGSFLIETGLAQFHSTRFDNILSTIDEKDVGGTIYYGKVGAIWFYSSNSSQKIMVQARTVNGNYGKTFPGLGVVDANSAVVNRDMVIQDIVQDSNYRTNVGVFNSSTTIYTVSFLILKADGSSVGNFSLTLAPSEFRSFNPFALAGHAQSSFSGCWLFIHPTAGDSTAPGVFCYGSIANNYTNDTYALIARMYL